MPLTPVEIRHIQLRRTFLRGYRAQARRRAAHRDRRQLRGGVARARRPRRPARGARDRGVEAPRAGGAPALDARLRGARCSGHEGAGQARIGLDRAGSPRGGSASHTRGCCREAAPRGRRAQDPRAAPDGARVAGRRDERRARATLRQQRREADLGRGGHRPGHPRGSPGSRVRPARISFGPWTARAPACGCA